MTVWQERLLLVLILVVAAGLRWSGLDWDEYRHYHPDERHIAWVASSISWPDDWSQALRPEQSTFNPFYWSPTAESEGIVVPQDQRRNFAYGHVPLYLGVAATALAERVGPWLIPYLPADWLLTRDILNGAEMIPFRHLTAVARFLSGLMDLGTLLLLYLLGRRLYNPAVGLLAAAFLAVTVLHIQSAHFFIVDPFLTFFVTAALYCLIRSVEPDYLPQRRDDREIFSFLSVLSVLAVRANAGSLRWGWWLLSGVAIGLAVGSKFAAVMLFVPLLLAAWAVAGARWLRWLLLGGGTAVFTFALTNPFALLDFGCEVITPIRWGIDTYRVNWGNCYLQNIVTQNYMVQGRSALAFTYQYDGTLSYLYYAEMLLRWGTGPLLGLLALVGLAWAVWRGLRPFFPWLSMFWTKRPSAWRDGLVRVWQRAQQPIPHLPHYLLLSWVVPYLLTTGNFQVKFMRYLLPVTPILLLYGAALVWEGRRTEDGGRRRWRWGVTAVTLLFTGLYALAFVNMYGQPHPWAEASRWVYASLPPGTLILSEQWDDALPSTMVVDGRSRFRSEYENQELTWLTGSGRLDNEAKLRQNLTLLAEADYLTIMSDRVYGVTPRLPQRYPLSGQYHQLLFDGQLGYEPVAVFGRFPHLGSVHLVPDHFGWPGLTPPTAVSDYLDQHPGLHLGRADESFTVYDQPLTIIFRKVETLTVEEMMSLFEIERDA
jgi:4-amino-4-deoxy-L-arabinose transferase-like glycosyltransferase